MTEIITKEEFLHNKDKFLGMIKRGSIFIHPTDTIYGIGCIADKKDSVEKIRKVKKHNKKKPFSVIAPDVNWIKNHLHFKEEYESHIPKLKKQHTFIMEPNSEHSKKVSEIVADSKTIGIRLIDHWFQEYIQEINKPVISTSVNRKGEIFMSNINDINEEIYKKIDFIIYEGEKKTKPSKVINLTTRKEKVIRDR